MEVLEMEMWREPVRFLIVEDDVTLRPIWLHILERWGRRHEVAWVSDVPAARQRLQEAQTKGRPYRFVISDIFLSGSLTGLDLWRDRAVGAPPGFLLTSVISDEKFRQWLATDHETPLYLQKPLDIDSALRKLEDLWELSRRPYGAHPE